VPLIRHPVSFLVMASSISPFSVQINTNLAKLVVLSPRLEIISHTLRKKISPQNVLASLSLGSVTKEDIMIRQKKIHSLLNFKLTLYR